MDEYDFLATKEELLDELQRLIAKLDAINDAPDSMTMHSANRASFGEKYRLDVLKLTLPAAFDAVLTGLRKGGPHIQIDFLPKYLSENYLLWSLREIMQACLFAGHCGDPAEFRQEAVRLKAKKKHNSGAGRARAEQLRQERARWTEMVLEFATEIRRVERSVKTSELAKRMCRDDGITAEEWLARWKYDQSTPPVRCYKQTVALIKKLEVTGKLAHALGPSRVRKRKMRKMETSPAQ